jgi:hypothetical protein
LGKIANEMTGYGKEKEIQRFFGLDKLNSFRKTHNSTVRTTVLEKLIHYEQFDWN